MIHLTFDNVSAEHMAVLEAAALQAALDPPSAPAEIPGLDAYIEQAVRRVFINTERANLLETGSGYLLSLPNPSAPPAQILAVDAGTNDLLYLGNPVTDGDIPALVPVFQAAILVIARGKYFDQIASRRRP